MSWLRLPENRLASQAIGLFGTGEKAPLQMVLWGPPGTGKTRLASRWLKLMRKANAEARLLRVPSQELSLRLRGVFVPPGQPVPKSRMIGPRRADGLVLEDIHRLTMKRSAALARLLDHRQARGLPTLLTSRETVSRLDLEAGTRDRLLSGLVVGLQALGPASRLKALEKQVPAIKTRLGETSRDWLARQAGPSWRGLTAVARVLKTRLASKGPVLDHPSARKLFADLEKPKLRAPDLIRLCARHFGVTETALKGKGRQPSLVLARQVTMAILRRHTELSLEKIGALLGGRDSATVRHSLAKMADTTHPMAQSALRELSRRAEG